jgi:hypothetical protein
MTEEQVKKILEEEMTVNFVIQTYKIIISRPYGPSDEYYKVYITIKEGNNEIKHEQILTEFTVKDLLKEIAKLNKIYKFSQNEKLVEGAREEILKNIAFLLWTLG